VASACFVAGGQCCSGESSAGNSPSDVRAPQAWDPHVNESSPYY